MGFRYTLVFSLFLFATTVGGGTFVIYARFRESQMKYFYILTYGLFTGFLGYYLFPATTNERFGIIVFPLIFFLILLGVTLNRKTARQVPAQLQAIAFATLWILAIYSLLNGFLLSAQATQPASQLIVAITGIIQKLIEIFLIISLLNIIGYPQNKTIAAVFIYSLLTPLTMWIVWAAKLRISPERLTGFMYAGLIMYLLVTVFNLLSVGLLPRKWLGPVLAAIGVWIMSGLISII